MKDELDDFSYHEVVDRSFIAMQMIETLLLNHQAIEAHPEFKENIENSISSLYEIYQAFGSASRETTTETEKE